MFAKFGVIGLSVTAGVAASCVVDEITQTRNVVRKSSGLGDPQRSVDASRWRRTHFFHHSQWITSKRKQKLERKAAVFVCGFCGISYEIQSSSISYECLDLDGKLRLKKEEAAWLNSGLSKLKQEIDDRTCNYTVLVDETEKVTDENAELQSRIKTEETRRLNRSP